MRTLADRDVDYARDSARVFAERLPVVARGIQHYTGERDFAGFEAFTLQRNRRDELRWRLSLVTIFSTLARIFGREGISEITTAIEKQESRMAACLAIIDRFPEYADYYRHDREERLASLSKKFRDKMQTDVDLFLERHPEIRSKLNDQ